MFTEILKIKPVLDSGTAQQMENSLHARFSRIANRFGSGLKNVVKGSVLGISLGLLNRLLNPIEALDEKIKSLLGHGTDVKDLAGRLGASPGELDQLQNVAKSFGLNTDQFKELILKFDDGIEKAKDEISKKIQPSDSTIALLPFVNEQNKVKGFKSFLTSLQTVGAVERKDQPLSAHAARMFEAAGKDGLKPEDLQKLVNSGEARSLTGKQVRQNLEKDVFGAAQFGPAKRLIDANLEEQAKKINSPSIDQLNKANEKLAGLEEKKLILEAQNQTKDFIEASSKINERMIQAMQAAEARQESEANERLGSYEDLAKGAVAVADILKGLNDLLGLVTTGLGSLQKITAFIPEATKSPFFKGIMKTFGKGN